MDITRRGQDIGFSRINNYPHIAEALTSYDELLTTDYKASFGYIPRKVVKGYVPIPDDDGCTRVYDQTIISTDSEHDADIIEEQLSKSIESARVFVDVSGTSDTLPSNPLDYTIVLDSDGLPDSMEEIDGKLYYYGDTHMPVYEVILNGETTLNKLYHNAYKYILNHDTNKYELTDDVAVYSAKFTKDRLRTEITTRFGDLEDLLADYARLLFFLYANQEFPNGINADDRDELASCTPDVTKMGEIVARTKELMDLVDARKPL